MTDAAFLARLTGADTDELIDLLARPVLKQEQLLRAYFGAERYRRLRSLALRKLAIRREIGDATEGNVLVIPGLLANELSTEHAGVREQVWLNARSLTAGYLSRLRLADNGLTDANPDYPVRVTGLMKRNYAELLLTLAQRWNVHTFAYDWRKSLTLAATQLQARIDESFTEEKPVQLVAAAEGGIVARLYIAGDPEHWARRGGRLITLGTPHTGAAIFVRALAGHLDIARWADSLDSSQNWQDFLGLVRSFPSLYQLLPFADPQQEDLYDANTYGGAAASVRQKFLDSARKIHSILPAVVDPARMIAVVGYNRLTTANVDLVQFKNTMAQPSAARIGIEKMNNLYRPGDGDGSVPRASAELMTPDGSPVPAYYVDMSQHELLDAPSLLRSLDELLTVALDSNVAWPQIGRHFGLRLAAEATASLALDSTVDLTKQAEEEWKVTRQKIESAARKLQRSPATAPLLDTAEEERLIEDIMVRHLRAGTTTVRTATPLAPFPPPHIVLDIVLGDITQLATRPLQGNPIDAIAFGHYIGATPQDALRALDAAITPWTQHRAGPLAAANTPRTDNLIGELAQRGVIRGDLATLFLLPDPRPKARPVQRVIAIAGMGLPGRFGPPELTLLVRELCWTLGRLGKQHLATVLIGAGQNNISADEAVRAWVRGIKLAITGAEEQGGLVLKQITFVENDPRKLPAIDQALQSMVQEMDAEKRMEITYSPLKANEYVQLKKGVRQRISREMQTLLRDRGLPSFVEKLTEPAPARITVEFEDDTYRFGAITATASMPVRDIQLDPLLVSKANDELAALNDLEQQARQGEFMARLLFPADFRADLSGGRPVILTVDATTARIHWELLSLSEQQLIANDQAQSGSAQPAPLVNRDLELCLGIACGLTRQLRTSFAQRMEPLPPAQRLLRVLVVADPAADARLPGAEEEGNAVADLLETFNLITPTKNRIEVVRLIGPTEATRTAVLQQLLTRSYDVLHFAGHCTYNTEKPAASGWIFTGGALLTANEIQRIDRVPALVVSNACESGITPDRSGERAAALAPTFAETFFARGVANFICTAWPVGDREARDFALTLYADLLGLTFNPPAGQTGLRFESRYYAAGQPQPIYRAMRNARRAIADLTYDRHSWGAYQHYGNPYARLFAPVAEAELRKDT